ncbi:MAG: transcriptional repressor [Anaerolineae bacterium]|nr:transcriptional repressor [Anaerolineae bacterium]
MKSQFDIFSNVLSKNGYRLTSARQIIIAALLHSGGHITADDLTVRVQADFPTIGRMTVYRTLDLLTELGLTRPIFQGTGAAHYILMAEGTHHHLICTRCHTVIEFDDCSTDDLLLDLATQFNFLVQSHLLEIHGVCTSCNV